MRQPFARNPNHAAVSVNPAHPDHHDPRVAPPLLDIAQNAREFERRWAARSLARHIDQPEVRSVLERAAGDDPDRAVRKAAKLALKGKRL
jgi:hypothetical protein